MENYYSYLKVMNNMNRKKSFEENISNINIINEKNIDTYDDLYYI